jgi:tRNA (guanine-N7-)-methyltransferase
MLVTMKAARCKGLHSKPACASWQVAIIVESVSRDQQRAARFVFDIIGIGIHFIQPMTAESPYHGNCPSDHAPDVDRHRISWSDLTEAFPEYPRELEIGSGKGLFLQSVGAGNPHIQYIGIELSGKFADRSAQKAKQRGLANVIFLRGDAKKFLQNVIPDSSLQRVHVYFPDPWWRNKHKKRRVLNEQTLADIQRVLIDGGEFHFWTDVLDYYEHICNEVMHCTSMGGPHYVPQKQAEHTMDYTTHFERRARLNNQPVYRSIFSN